MRNLIIICSTFFSIHGFSQNIKGQVIDSSITKPIEYATIALMDLQDSSLFTYTISSKNGRFALHNIPNDHPYRIVVSCIGFGTYKKNISVKSGEIVNINVKLTGNEISLKEVVVHAERVPVMYRKDTLEFSAEAFKTRPNALVEELLKKLPGVQVNKDGSIQVNGKKINKVQVNGKNFFGTNITMATRNLNADLIDKVQVFDDRENDPDHLITLNKLGKIINLKLKSKYKKSFFGKTYVAGGTKERYEAGGIFNSFKDTLQISLLGFGNNINRSSFSFGDLQNLGGFDRSGINGLNINNNDEVTGVNGIALGGDGSGLQKIGSGGLNINNDYGKKLKINLQYFYSYLNNKSTVRQSKQEFLKDTTLFTNSDIENTQIQKIHNISAAVRWSPDSLSTFTYEPKLSFNKQTGNSYSTAAVNNNYAQLLTKNDNFQLNQFSQEQYSHSVWYYHKFRNNGNSLTLRQNISSTPNVSNLDSRIYSSFFAVPVTTDTINRIRNQNDRDFFSVTSLDYKISLNTRNSLTIGLEDNRHHHTYSIQTYSGQVKALLPLESSDFKRNELIQKINIGFNTTFSKQSNLNFKLSGANYDIKNYINHQLFSDRGYFYLVPQLEVNLGKISINYYSDINQPSITDLLPATNLTTPLVIFTGNPSLEIFRSHKLSLAYSNYYVEKQLSLNFYLDAAAIDNGIVYKRDIKENAEETISPINLHKGSNGNIHFYSIISKKYSRNSQLKFNVNSKLGSGIDINPVIVNNLTGSRRQYSLSVDNNVNINWNDIIELTPGFQITKSVNVYDHVNFNNVTYLLYRANSELIVNYPKKLTFSINDSYRYIPNIESGLKRNINLLNASVTLKVFSRDRGEIKLSVYDFLNQNVNYERFINQNIIIDSQTTVLRRYGSLGLIYNFNKKY